MDVLQPIFQRLSNPVLLEGSKDCFTQNPNESLHHLVWDKCPKSSFAGAATVEIAACLGMLEFNGGHHCYAELLTTLNRATMHRQHLQSVTKSDCIMLLESHVVKLKGEEQS